MDKRENNLEHLRGTNPFKVPEGYMEGLTDRIMSQLPEKLEERAKQISLMDRVRPWLYLAAVFAGLGLFFKAIVGLESPRENLMVADSLLVRTEIPESSWESGEGMDDEEAYLEYLEDEYAYYLMEEDLDLSE